MYSIVITLLLGAGAFDTIFDAGVAAYEKGEYAAAAQSFQQLADEGVAEPEVFYNLGNAYYRSGKVGPAIANYERALQLQPNLLVARENLSRAVNATERRLKKPEPPAWEQSILFWHENLDSRTVYWTAAAAWILFWALLIARQFTRAHYLRRAAAVALLIAIACAASYYAKTHPQQLAVASANRVPVHYGTSKEETVRFELYEGDRVLVDAREEGWARVVTAQGERGWAEASLLTFVGPPYDSGDAVSAPADTAESIPAETT